MISSPQSAIAVPSISAMGSLDAGGGSYIDITELREVDYWTETLGVSEAELRIAVANVGESAQDVRDHLGK